MPELAANFPLIAYEINRRRAATTVAIALLVSVGLGVAGYESARGHRALAVWGAVLGAWIFLAVGLATDLIRRWLRGFPLGQNGGPQRCKLKPRA